MSTTPSQPARRAVYLRRIAAGAGGLALVAGLIALSTLAGRGVVQAQDAADPSGAGGAGALPPADGGATALPGRRPPGATVRIVFKVIPPNKATVTWGKKKLGLIKPRAPLVIERPRDSGPLDVVVRAEGCLPVHTRAYTFTDTTLAVRVTPLDKKNTLFGYREDVPPDADGGVPPAPENAPPAGSP